MTRQCFCSASAATWAGDLPASIWSAKKANESAQMEHSTVLTRETFCDEPTARNSNRWPPYGKGDVRLRSSAGMAEVDLLGARDVLLEDLGLHELLEVGGDVVAQVRRDDRRGRLHGAEAEVVAGRGDGHAHEVTVQVDARVGAERNVVVLARAVDVLKGLLVRQAGETVAGRHLVGHLHDDEVLIDLGGGGTKVGRKLVLVGGNLAVARLEWDAHHEALVLDLLHARHGDRVDGRHVVVRHLLAARRIPAQDGAAGQLQVRPPVEVLARHKKELLLQTNVGKDLVDIVAHKTKEASRLLGHGLHRAEQRRLLVQSVAVEGDEDGRDEDGVAAEEDGRGRVEDCVAAGGVGGPHAAVGERGAVRLALEQSLALKLPLGLAILVEGEHCVLHLATHAMADPVARHRLEPVGDDTSAHVMGPGHDRIRDLVRRGLCPRRVVQQARRQALLGEVPAGRRQRAQGVVPRQSRARREPAGRTAAPPKRLQYLTAVWRKQRQGRRLRVSNSTLEEVLAVVLRAVDEGAALACRYRHAGERRVGGP
eukprot:scaffold10429_cov122-Isochrysis_galbana.AAC.3